MTDRYQTTNKFTGEIVFKFKDYLYYDDFVHMSEEDKKKEIKKDPKILGFLGVKDKNKIYMWNHYWGFCEDEYMFKNDTDLCD